MIRSARLFTDRSGAAAAEMALVAPLLLALMFGVAELGRYFWSEHILLKGVRDGAIYAARQRVDHFNCTTGIVDAAVVNSTKALVQTGLLSGGTPRLANWSSAQFAIDLACVTSANGVTLNGIYTANGGKVPVVTVRATVPYVSMFGLRLGLNVNASQQAAVYGA